MSIKQYFLWAYFVFSYALVNILLFTFYLPDNVFYDQQYIYVKRINGEISIDLKDVDIVKPVGLSYNRRSGRYLWKIKYMRNGIEKAVRVYPVSTAELDNFIDHLKLINPEVLIDYSANLDFDI